MDSGSTQSEKVLYRDQFAKVTPTWFTNQTPIHSHRTVNRPGFFQLVVPPAVEKTSYAISTMMRLSFVERVDPPLRSLILFFFCLALVFFSSLYLIKDVLPTAVAGALLAVSLFVFGWSTWYTFLKKPVYQIKAFFVDGTVVNIRRQRQEQAYGLYRALDDAKSGFVSSELQSDEQGDQSDDVADDDDEEEDDYAAADTDDDHYSPVADDEIGLRETALQRRMHRLKAVFAIMSRSRN